MKVSGLRVRFAVILLPFTALFVILLLFAILAIRLLLLDQPQRSDEIRVSGDLELLINQLDNIDRAIRNFGETQPLRFSALLQVQRPELERVRKQMIEDGLFARYPELAAPFESFQHEIERHARVPMEEPRSTTALEREITLLENTAKQTREAHEASLFRRIAQVERTARLATWTLVGGMFAGLFLTGLLAWRLSARTLRPIEVFIESARKIGAGEIEAEVMYRGNDEFRQLATAFTEMSGRLREYHARLSGEAQSERERMSALLEHLPFPVFFFDREGKRQLANQSGERLLAAPELEGRLPEEISKLVAHTRETLVCYAPEKLDAAIYVHAYHDELAFLPRVFALDPPHTTAGTALVLLDVTKLRLSSDLRRDLLSIVSHEFKTPLTSTLLALRIMLENEEPLTAMQREMIETAVGELERHHRTIENLLDLGFLVKGERPLQKARVPVDELFERLREDWEATALRAGKQLEIPPPPAPAPDLLVDPARTRLALGCVIANGLRHSPEGGTLHVQTREWEDELCVEVIDEGPGIPESFRERVFERFFRVPDTPDPGEGVGLSVARELVEAHGGRIWCGEAKPHGAIFTICLPTAPEAE